MKTPTLLASASDGLDILISIREFYCGTDVSIVGSEPNVYRIVRKSDGKTLEGVRVVKARGRFRFEMLA